MKGKIELQAIFEFDENSARIWGYEVLYRGNIPNDLLFGGANPAFEFELFKKEIKATRNIDDLLTFNLSLKTLTEFQDEIKEVLRKRENILIEVTEIPYSFKKVSEEIKRRLIIDDFLRKGSGLDRVLDLKPLAVKLEKEFVPIINLENFEFPVIVEKVEKLDELEKLKGKAKLFQGFLFKPYSIILDL